MIWREKALQYEKQVLPFFKGQKSDIFTWIKKYPVCHSSRSHMFSIFQDILTLPLETKILEQGAAEGVICRLLQDSGYDVVAMDIEPVFKKMWDHLKIKGVIGDGYRLDWWDGTLFDVVIACVWVTSMGKKLKGSKDVGKSKIERLIAVENSWYQMLSPGGLVFVDINDRKVPLKVVYDHFSDRFNITQFMLKPRIVLKLEKK